MVVLDGVFQVHLGHPEAYGPVGVDHRQQSGANNMVYQALEVRLAVPPVVDPLPHSCAYDAHIRPVSPAVGDMYPYQVLLERPPPVPLPFEPVPYHGANRADIQHIQELMPAGELMAAG
jgi:hypothetical protein